MLIYKSSSSDELNCHSLNWINCNNKDKTIKAMTIKLSQSDIILCRDKYRHSLICDVLLNRL